MKLTTTERKVNVSQSVHEYAERKISKLDRFFSKESEATLVFSRGRDRYIVELTLVNGSLVFRVTESTSDMRASIDSAVAAIERQIRKNKTRLAKRLRDGVFEHEAAPDVTYESSEEENREPEFNIVRSKKFPIKPMSPEEAVLQMNLLGHEFYVFKNQDRDEAFSVIYRRKQGDYGMIESLE